MRDELLEKIRDRGLVPVTEVVAWILGERPRGSWWSHPGAKKAYAILIELEEETGTLLGAKLIDGKETYVHRRLWPALIRAQSEPKLWPALSRAAKATLRALTQKGPAAIQGPTRLQLERSLRVISQHRHTERGHHEAVLVPFEQWVTPKLRREADALSLEDAVAQLKTAGLSLKARR